MHSVASKVPSAKGKSEHVAFDEVDAFPGRVLGFPLAANVEHLRRVVEAGHVVAGLRHGEGEATGSAAGLEHGEGLAAEEVEHGRDLCLVQVASAWAPKAVVLVRRDLALVLVLVFDLLVDGSQIVVFVLGHHETPTSCCCQRNRSATTAPLPSMMFAASSGSEARSYSSFRLFAS